MRPAASGLVKLRFDSDPKSAYWSDEGFPPSPLQFVSACVYELATRTEGPVVLGDEQLDFLALVASKVEDVHDSQKEAGDG